MLEHAAHVLTQYLQSHPNMGGLIAFSIAFLESLAVVGAFIPGSVTMTAVGIIVGANILPFNMILFWSSLGAILGDLISYWLGSYYNVRLRNMWPFTTRPHWLTSGEAFFHRHGVKSVFIGRFAGPLRSLIPLIAGILHMPWQKFLLAAIPASVLWAVAYMLPGILIGAMSLKLPPAIATKFVLLALLFILLISLFAWLITRLFNNFLFYCSRLIKKAWIHMQIHNRFRPLVRLIEDKNFPDNYHQLTWLLLSILSGILFLFVLMNVLDQNFLATLNRPIFEFLRSLRQPAGDRFFVGMTILGEKSVLPISALIIFGWLIVHKNYRTAIHWLAAILIAAAIPQLFKELIYFPRPSALLRVSSSSSFPSGHAFLAMIYYGFLAIIVCSYLSKKTHRYIYNFVALVILLVGFSRLYLGAHWLTDVLASLFLGYAFLCLLTLSYRRNIVHLDAKRFGIFAVLATLATWAIYTSINYQNVALRYTLQWPTQTVAMSAWWGQLNPNVPIYRPNRIGIPSEPMNVQYLGDIQQLKIVLSKQGWTANPDTTVIENTLQKLAKTSDSFGSILPSLYLNHPPALYMEMSQPKSKLILRLWHANIYLAQSWDTLYLGNIVEYQMQTPDNGPRYTFNITDRLQTYLRYNHWLTTTVKEPVLPKTLQNKLWRGDILQISAPSFH